VKTLNKYPIASYYLLTLLISWGGLVLMVGGPEYVSSQPSQTPFLPLYLITVAGPFLAGIILTGLINGKEGYRNLFHRLLKWRLRTKWYMAIIFIPLITVFTALFALTIVSPIYTPGIFSEGTNPIAVTFGLPDNDKMMLVLFVVMIGLFNGFVEELGWTGFVTPRLKQNQSLLTTGIGLGIMWGLWHLLANYIGSAEGAGTIPLILFLPFMLFTFLPPFRILMLWVYKHTQSLFLAIMMHASLDVFWMLSMPVAITGKERMIWYSTWAFVLWVSVLFISVADRKKLNVIRK